VLILRRLVTPAAYNCYGKHMYDLISFKNLRIFPSVCVICFLRFPENTATVFPTFFQWTRGGIL